MAEDAFQATFLQLHLKCHQFEPGRRLRPWLYTIATNQATDLLRRNRRHKATSLNTTAEYVGASDERQPLGDLLETTDAGPSERLESAEDCQQTQLALESIPAKLMDVARSCRIPTAGAFARPANVLGIPLGTVKSRMNKALQSLRKAMITTGYAASNEISGPLMRQGELILRTP